MSKFKEFLQSGIKSIDLLTASQFLRYKGQSDYKTVTGGLITLTVIAISIALFANMGLLTINRQIINSSVSYSMNDDPPPITFKMNPENKFMIIAGIVLLDLNDPNIRYFDIHLYHRIYSQMYQFINQTQIPLSQCTLDHLAFNQQMKNNYYRLNMSRNLCPPMDYQFSIGGKVSSSFFSELEISINKCNSTLHNNCVTDAALQQFQLKKGAFPFFVGMINPLINPGDVDYLKIFMEDRNYFNFSPFSSNGVQAIAEIQSIQVNTDMTLMPYSEIHNQQYISIPDLFIYKNHQISNDQYAKVRFNRSSKQTIYTRSFNKIDNYLSYIGGLVGTVLLSFFVISKFAQLSYVLDLSGEIFKKQPDSQEKIGSMFNFFSYICLNFHSFLSLIKIKLKWQKTLKFKSYLAQMQQKLSIQYILKKIMFLDEAVSVLLNDEQIIALYFKQKKSIEQFQQKRRQQKIYLEMQAHATKEVKEKYEQQQTNKEFIKNQKLKNFEASDLSPKERQPPIESINQHSGSLTSKHDKALIKKAICKVMNLKEQGDTVSERIIQKISKSKLVQLGLLSSDQSSNKLRTSKFVAVADIDKKKDVQKFKKNTDIKLIIEEINSQEQQVQRQKQKADY